MKEYFLKLSV